jgi:hypothetical protein
MFLLVAGFAIVAGALLLLGSGMSRGAFVITGLAVEIFGLALVFSAHYTLDNDAR